MARTDPHLRLRLPADLKERITAEAKRNKRSINAEILDLLEDRYPEPVSIEDTVKGMRRSIGFIRAVRGEGMLQLLAEELDQLLGDIMDRGLLSPEEREKAKKAIADNWERRVVGQRKLFLDDEADPF